MAYEDELTGAYTDDELITLIELQMPEVRQVLAEVGRMHSYHDVMLDYWSIMGRDGYDCCLLPREWTRNQKLEWVARAFRAIT